jgi:uncharacterized phage protein (TIGR01671 family)
MTREILFRGKRIDDGEWAEGDLVHGLDVQTAIQFVERISKNTTANRFFEVDPATIGQYTGRKDKNGVRIFEGDNAETGHRMSGEVVYSGHCFGIKNELGICTDFDDWQWAEFEITGSIHDKGE